MQGNTSLQLWVITGLRKVKDEALFLQLLGCWTDFEMRSFPSFQILFNRGLIQVTYNVADILGEALCCNAPPKGELRCCIEQLYGTPCTIGSSFAECSSICYWQQLYGTQSRTLMAAALQDVQFHLLLAAILFTIGSSFIGCGPIYYWQQLCGMRSHMLLAIPASWQLFTTKLRCAVGTCNWKQLTQ